MQDCYKCSYRIFFFFYPIWKQWKTFGCCSRSVCRDKVTLIFILKFSLRNILRDWCEPRFLRGHIERDFTVNSILWGVKHQFCQWKNEGYSFFCFPRPLLSLEEFYFLSRRCMSSRTLETTLVWLFAVRSTKQMLRKV